MRVAAAVIAKKWLAERFGVCVRGHLAQIGDVVPRSHDWSAVEGNPFFWPDAAQVPELETFMDALRKRSEEHTSELQSLMRTSYAVFCLQQKTTHTKRKT